MSSTIISRLEALEAQSNLVADLTAEVKALRAEVAELRAQIFGDGSPAPKQVGMVVSKDGKRTMSEAAKKAVSDGVKRAAAAKKAAKLAAAEAAKTESPAS